ncbi:hypothetical protein GGR52DRAFT_561015 [Hypoxylon sp. FL1284]|nr:hypothetical protein GGR52DRAFT_561015 [Hypoxylon sp. FL1284]
MANVMDSAPQEIIDNIVSFLPDGQTARFATVSKKWQSAVERYTFANLTITSDFETMAKFQTVLKHGRCRFLRSITFIAKLPQVYALASWNELNVRVRNPNPNRILPEFPPLGNSLTIHVQRLFKILAEIDNLAKQEKRLPGGCKGIDLVMGQIKSVEPRPEEAIHRPGSVELYQSDERIPTVECVTSYRIAMPEAIPAYHPCVIWIGMRSAFALVKHLPRVRNFKILVDAFIYRELRYMGGLASLHFMEFRRALARALPAGDYLSGTQCTELSIMMEAIFSTPDYESKVNTRRMRKDRLSIGMHNISHGLVTLKLSGIWAPQLFWPAKGEDALPDRPWPRLHNFEVDLANLVPGKGRYFVSKTDDGRTSWHLDIPVDDELNLLLKAWAQALQKMPVIENAYIQFNLDLKIPARDPVKIWRVGFYGPPPARLDGYENPVGPRRRDVPQLLFQNDRGWRPSSEVMMLLHEAGHQRFQERMLEVDMNHLGMERKERYVDYVAKYAT